MASCACSCEERGCQTCCYCGRDFKTKQHEFREKLDIAVKALEERTKRSNYTWSAGGQYSVDDAYNEGSIQCAEEILKQIRGET